MVETHQQQQQGESSVPHTPSQTITTTTSDDQEVYQNDDMQIMKNDATAVATAEDTTSTASSEDSSLATSTTTTSKNKKRVTFSTLQIREYPITLGDNPATNFGPPVCIDWKHETVSDFQVDAYESQKPEPRTMAQLLMPSSTRREILGRAGFARRQLVVMCKPVVIARNNRKATNATMQLSPMYEISELMYRGIKNATFGRKAKQEQRTFLAPYKEQSELQKDKSTRAHSICTAKTLDGDTSHFMNEQQSQFREGTNFF